MSLNERYVVRKDIGRKPITAKGLMVRDLMTTDLLTLSEENTLKDLAELFGWKAIRHVPIVLPDQTLTGLVTQRDFLTLSLSKLSHHPKEEVGDLYSRILIGEIMGRKVLTVSPETDLSEAAEIMYSRKFGCLPVTEGGKLKGIITEADFVRAFF